MSTTSRSILQFGRRLRDGVLKEEYVLIHVPGKTNPADMLTKGLPGPLARVHSTTLLGEGPANLDGAGKWSATRHVTNA